jgi:hypothetical protein
MKRRHWTIVLSSMLVLQFVTAGASSFTHAAESIPLDQDTRMCGGSHFLNSEAYRNAMEAYELNVVEASQESAALSEHQLPWKAVWK